MIYSVNFLRFVAAFAVVLSHVANVVGIQKTIQVGDAGVDVFFIISGFVINLTHDGPMTFLTRRLIRVMPLYWLMTGAYIAFTFGMWRVTPAPGDLLYSLLLIPRSVDWPPVLFQGWTLSYELFFYVTFATALAISTRRAPAIALAALLVIGFLPVPFETPLFAEFGAGMAVSAAWQRGWIRPSRTVGYGLILTACAAFYIARHGGGFRDLWYGVPSLMLLLGMLSLEPVSWFRGRIPVLLGQASYALYLSHILVMVALREALRTQIAWTPEADYAAGVVCLAPVAVLVSVIIHRMVERPLFAWLRPNQPPAVPARPPVVAGRAADAAGVPVGVLTAAAIAEGFKVERIGADVFADARISRQAPPQP